MNREAPFVGKMRRAGKGLWGLWTILSLAAALRLLPALLLSSDACDLHLYREMGEVFLKGQNIYAETRGLYPYTPISLPIPGLILALSLASGWPFPVLMKIPAILGDLGIVWLLSHMGSGEAGVSRNRGLAWALTYALNPIGILIAGFQGNIVTLVAFVCLISYYLLERSRKAIPPGRDQVLSAVVLGIAIALRGFPVLIAPIFALRLRRTSWMRYLMLAALPSVMSLAPYFAVTPGDVLREVFGYSGQPILGWAALVRATAFLQGDFQTTVTWLLESVRISKIAFLGAYSALVAVCLRAGWFSTLRATMLVWLLFYSIYGGVAPQYLVWLIPFAIVAEDRALGPFSVGGAIAVTGFFLFGCPEILLGPHELPRFARQLLGFVLYVAGGASLWLYGVAWAGRLWRESMHERMNGDGDPMYGFSGPLDTWR